MPEGLALALLVTAAPAQAVVGELVLDAARPTVAVRLGGVAMRLRVDLRQSDAVALNPVAAARLGVRWRPGAEVVVGRERLAGRISAARLEIAGAGVFVPVASYARDIAPEADGAIGPDLLPYAAVRFRRADAPAANGARVLPIDRDPRIGWSAAAPELSGAMRLIASLALARTSATAAAGSALAQNFGGSLAGEAEAVPVAFGLTRPARTIRFARPPVVAGFRIEALPVRIGDYRGANPLPEDPASPGDIVVARREAPQAAEYWIMLGADRLGACAEVIFSRAAETLTLRCRFDVP